MAKFVLDQIQAINGISDAQVKRAKQILNGKRVADKASQKLGNAPKEICIEAENEAALIEMLAPKVKEVKERDITVKRDFNAVLVETATTALKYKVKPQAIIDAITTLYKNEANKKVDNDIAKLQAKIDALNKKKI